VDLGVNLSGDEVNVFLVFGRTVGEIPSFGVNSDSGVGPRPKTLAEGVANGLDKRLVWVEKEELLEVIYIDFAVNFKQGWVGGDSVHESLVRKFLGRDMWNRRSSQ
jgi:hypothetical protein